ncbi:helix-turn-helix domain-containing protein [Lacticaseibacillus pantheris]|uniref:helix-turn-helix domain-containing protein n=1 Tax=Lacticaseibacillus pantheris TaxID=171523 RepID=UPI002658E9CA|nr:helix-turn-helix transcriptional regulator [Lacticaseibacillus pantheris]WKF84455.1 helix-turn-helix transcriptional regulator [Lacticaseibacillus pantheris]
MFLYSTVRNLAEQNGKTIYRIEHDLSLSNGTISKWNESMPRADTLQKVADYLGVTSAQILERAKKEDN